MRSIYKGSISFGLVHVPVKMYGATEEHDAVCHQIHAADGGRIRYKKVCETCSEGVEFADIAKAYEYGKEDPVILTDADLKTLPSEQDRTIEVLEFVPAESLNPMLYEKSYFLGPEKGADKPYVLLAETLARVQRVALVQFAMRGKTRLAALTVLPKGGVLVAHTLRWPDEIRHPEFAIQEVEIKPLELDLAEQIVESMANEFNPDRYRDTYQVELQELIAAKATGQALPSVAAEQQEADDVSDLLAKLEASIKGKK